MSSFKHHDPESETARLLRVIETIQAEDFTLWNFLTKVFQSKNSKIKAFVNPFYTRNGPVAVFRCWGDNLDPDQRQKLVKAACPLVADFLRDELSSLSDLKELRLPAEKIKEDDINNFSLAFINKKMEKTSPELHSMLVTLTTANENTQKDAKIIVPTIGSILVYLRSRNSNYLQTIMGLYLHSSGTESEVIDVLSHAGISVSTSSILRALKQLTKDALDRVKEVVRTRAWLLVYDNINLAKRKYNQRIGNEDSFENGTTATIIVNERLHSIKKVRHQYDRLRIEDIIPDRDDEKHFLSVCRFHLVDVLKRRRMAFKNCSIKIPAKHILPAAKTQMHPLPSMHIDQSSVEGNLQILYHVMKHQLKLEPEWFEDDTAVLVVGDHMTVSRLRSIMELREQDIPHFENMEWVVPVMQLFHLQMAFSNLIIRHYHGSVKTPGSIAYNVAMLNRKHILGDKPDFHAARELIQHTFDAMVITAWEDVLGTADLDALMRGKTDREINSLITLHVDTLCDRYFTDAGFRSQNGIASTNAALFMRDTVLFIELKAAIKVGDIGRIEEVLKSLAVLFQAAQTKNYAIELLRITCDLKHSWPQSMKTAIMSSWLVNTTGKLDGWLPTDLLQEHNNLQIKKIHGIKGSNGSWSAMSESVSANIQTFSSISKVMVKQFDAPYNSGNHSTVPEDNDIGAIVRSLKESRILSCQPRPDNLQDCQLVNDLYQQGMLKLCKGGIKAFVQKYGSENPLDSSENPLDPSENPLDTLEDPLDDDDDTHQDFDFDGF
ncbi:hypothetical protein BGZ65_005350 [Modicella reniformis]|uniref:DUF6589 domain-containing protein n=1 Tax=Modicella reniformis TaxID=1440133 RepID=A0A9P6SL79_9FUNG|nr:hypothetical protein BGZ65_005350 [Modicella reniformis]